MQSLKKFYFGKSKFKPFVSTWKTNNLSSGSSTATQVKLPLVSTGSYNFVVEWGDGTQSVITTWNQAQVTKTYSVAGTYTITIKGICIGWCFDDGGDKLKLLSIQAFGVLRIGNSGNYFKGCSNLTLISVSDILDLTGTTSLKGLFFGCSALTTVNLMSNWNVSSIINLQEMVALATNFNQNIGSWNVSNVTNMSAMFFSAQKFNQNITNWAMSNVLTCQNMFVDAQRFNQPIGVWLLGACVNFGGMFSSAIDFNQNIGNWNVSNGMNFLNFMSGKTLSTFSASNLDAIYNGWSTSPIKPGISITFGTAKYTAASAAGRAILTGAPNNWVITDGGI